MWYFQVKLVRLVGIMLIVFVKEEHVDHIFDVMAEHVATGLMGVMVSTCIAETWNTV